MIKIDSNGIKRIVSESVTRILENYFSGNYNAFEEKDTDGRESDEKTENAKEKERRNQVEDYFHNPGVDIAPFAYQLYNIDVKEGEDTNEMKNARSKFAKCLNHEENESGYPYSFTSSEITSLYSIISSNQLSESVKRSVKKALAKTLNEGKYDNSPITKWVYWCFNYHYPQQWIPELWGSGAMGEHMMKKFKFLYEKYGPSGVMNKFFVELDQENQEKLIDYVMNNY
jgi:hypothetical protein